MITRNVSLTIQGKTAKLDSPVYFYRGDGAVQINVEIKELQYKFGKVLMSRSIVDDSVKYASITVLKPDGQTAFEIPNAQRANNVIEIVMRPQFMNDLNEIGVYTFQIHLFDSDNRRVSIPPFEFEVLDVIADVNSLSPYMNLGEVDKAKVSLSLSNETELTKFKRGDLITADKLNMLIDKITELEEELAQYKNDNQPIE